ncbi:MAG: rod-binding protein [Magnetococcales bacterium]|nr:rod-binding protein [Magnetococcales bacterium]
MSTITPIAQPIPAISTADQKRLNDATADFEAMFINQLLKSMRKTVPDSQQGNLFAKGHGEKMFEEMLDGEYSKNFSRGHSGLGLKEAIFKQTVTNQLGRGIDPKNALNRLQGSENSFNAMAHSPIGKEGVMQQGSHAPLKPYSPTASNPQRDEPAAVPGTD